VGIQPYTYTLPSKLIAQRPIEPREEANLLVVDKATKTINLGRIKDLPEIIDSNYFMVFNDTKVIPARFFGETFNGTKIELLLISEINGNCKFIGKPNKVLIKADNLLLFGNDLNIEPLKVKIEYDGKDNTFVIEFDDTVTTFSKYGNIPIPPYIRSGKSDSRDAQDYQTVFAKNPGSIAAPTASLHFTPELLSRFDRFKVARDYLTLHISTASFRKAVTDTGDLIPPGVEMCYFPSSLYGNLLQHRENKGKIVAIGTTVTRALESGWNNKIDSWIDTDLFIEPGYEFKCINSLMTNFHQPRTTHLLLVEALLGKELLKKCYDIAIKENFRFLSYGDAMLII
jgi:S-adenosylmethionine:tRNA ribosyltransferase-isomerase